MDNFENELIFELKNDKIIQKNIEPIILSSHKHALDIIRNSGSDGFECSACQVASSCSYSKHIGKKIEKIGG